MGLSSEDPPEKPELFMPEFFSQPAGLRNTDGILRWPSGAQGPQLVGLLYNYHPGQDTFTVRDATASKAGTTRVIWDAGPC